MRRSVKFTAAAASIAVIVIFLVVILRSPDKPATLSRSDATSYAMADTMAVQEPPPPSEAYAPSGGAVVLAESGEPSPIQISLPRLAYAYTIGFKLPDAKLAEAQEGHRKLCEAMGAARCQLLSLVRGTQEDKTPDATLKLRIASGEARSFLDRATGLVSERGGRATATSVIAEDVSKDMVDTEARIRQRELLVTRLTDILRSRNGKVAELVEAERSVATAQEELDQARTWLAELRARVAMSDLDIRYTAIAPVTTPQASGSQIGDAVRGSGAAFLIALKGGLIVLIFLLPWALIAIPLVLLANAAARRARCQALIEEAEPEMTPA